jgi:uncharacterized repeat protein (TIGR01451 family)
LLSGSTLYGTTEQGGSAGYGTIYKIGTSGSGFSILYNFTGGNDGSYPKDALALSSAGTTLYGTASGRGSANYGTLFSVSTAGTNFITLYTFTDASDGADPVGGLILSGNALYGATAGDGETTYGTVFDLSLTTGTSYQLNYSVTGDVDVSKLKGNETDPAVAVNPNSPTNVFTVAVSSATNLLFTSYTANGITWTTGSITNANGNYSPYGEPTVAWDANSNLFVAYEPASFQGIAVLYSTNGGTNFFALTNLVPNDVTDQPRITAGLAGTPTNSVWLVYKDYSLPNTPLVAQGLTTTNIGAAGIGAFGPQLVIPGSSNGGFPDIAIGPNNQVMVAYQNNPLSAVTSKVFVNVNTNASLTNGFGPAITVASNAIGGFTYIPAEMSANGINAGVGLAWDMDTASPFYGRAYAIYSSAVSGRPAAINVELQYSINNGTTWSAPVQVNDDTGNTYSHFLPRIALDQSTGSIALCWDDCRNDSGSEAGIAVPIPPAGTNDFTNVFTTDNEANDDYMPYGTVSLSGGTSFTPNVPLIPTNVTKNASAGSQIFASSAALANNVNGLGHHLGLAYAAGNTYPVWPDNSGATTGNPDGSQKNFDLCSTISAVLQTADLGVGLVVTPTNGLTSDEIIAYYVIVTNYGPSTANSVVLMDTLPAGVTLVSVTPAAGGSFSLGQSGLSQTITFDFSSMAKNQIITNLIRITASQSGWATNTVSATSSLPDPNLANNSLTTNNLIDPEDLAVSITSSTNEADIGAPVNYSVTVTNLGPAANGLVFITNTIPSTLTQITNVVVTNGGTWVLTNKTLIFSLGTIPVSNSVTVSYSAYSVSLGSQYQFITNAVFATSTDFDPNYTNNYATNIVPILGEDLAVGISPSATNVNIGDTVTYTLNITNLGPSSTGNLVLTNVLSVNAGQITLVDLPPGSGSVSGNTISFSMGTLGVGQIITVVYTAVAESVGSTNTNMISSVTVTSSDFDTNLANNTALAMTTINGEDLAFGLVGAPNTVPAGQPITYTETVTNLGLSTNGVISVTNILSTNVSSIAVLSAPGTYAINGHSVVFQVGTLGVGQAASIVFTAVPTSIGTAIDTATAGSPDFDTNLLNNSAQATTTVVAPAALVSNFTVYPFASSAFIVWSTPFPTTSQVAYGLTTNYGNITSLSPSVTNHVVLLTGLVRNTNYYFNAMTWGQGVYSATNGSFATMDSLILNTQDASYSGTWSQGSSSISGCYGSYFNTAITTPYNPTASAIYTPTIPVPGFYNVSVWYPQNTNFATDTQIFVTGATNVVVQSVNQTTNGGSWQPLATNVYYAVGTGGNAIVYNDTGDSNHFVAANAMQWTYAGSQDYPSNGVPPAWWTSFYFGTNTAAAISNYTAYVFGTAPNDPADTPDYWLSFPSSNTVAVAFAPYLGDRIYQLQTTTNLAGAQWMTLTNQPVVDTNASGIYTNGTGNGVFTLIQTNTAPAFFRISAQLAPE